MTETPGRRIANRRSWIVITTIGAVMATALDAALLERRYGFFTGGFLAIDHVTGAADAIVFMAASLLADAAVAGFAAAIVLWASSRTRLSEAAGSFLALAAAVAPLCVANIVSYRIAQYVGDVLNLPLLFDLTGHKASEFVAVGAGHSGGPLLMAAGGGAAIVGLAWAVHRNTQSSRSCAPVSSRIFVLPLLLFLSGTVVTAMVRHESAVLDNGLRRKPSAQMLGWISARATDVDRDGYGWLDTPADPAPWDARSFPYAVDVPGNGIDEDGIAGDLPVSEPYSEGAPLAGPWTSTPDVVLVVLESFRADMVGAVHNGVAVTPVLNALAASGISSRYAYSHNGYTSQSRHHIFSGSVAGTRPGSLVDDFKRNGYEVAYFSGQDESFGGPALDVGFDRADVAYDARVEPDRRYSAFTTAGSLAVPFPVVEEHVQAFLQTRTSDRPLFLYVNFHDTHFPYHHRDVQPILDVHPLAQADIAPDREADLRATYANTAANVDRAIGRVLEAVRRVRGKQPGVVVVADHGESLFDDGVLGHGVNLTEVQTRIPLIVANLPVAIEEPIGQAGLRDAIDAALMRPAPGARPILRDAGEAAEVFQYLGTFEHPGQIAFTRKGTRTIFDFRSGLVRPERSMTWQTPESLDEQARRTFVRLVRTWERMRLAARTSDE